MNFCGAGLTYLSEFSLPASIKLNFKSKFKKMFQKKIMGLFGNKSFNKKKAPVRKTVSLNNLSQNPTVRAADLHPDPENVSLYDS